MANRLLIFVVAGLSACDWQLNQCTEAEGVDPAPVLSALDVQRDRWSNARPERYTTYTHTSCFGCPGWAMTSVSGQTVTAAFSPSDIFHLQPASVMEDWFDEVADVVRKRPAKFSVVYDETLGYPKRISYEHSVCWSDDEFSTHVSIVSPAHIAGVSGAMRCATSMLGNLAGEWQVVSAPNWLLTVTPVTAAVTISPVTYSTSVSEAAIRLFDGSGASTLVTVTLTAFSKEPWCGAAIQLENRIAYSPEAAFAVFSDDQFVIWNPTVVEQEGSREAQWRFSRK